MKKDLQIIMALSLIMGLFANCAKPGCTDSKATNYKADAKKDDGSCTYTGSVMFWMNGIPQTNGNVDVRLNGQNQTISLDYTSGTPACGSTGCANFKNIPTGTYNFVAEDQFPVTYQNVGEVIVTANSCLQMKLN